MRTSMIGPRIRWRTAVLSAGFICGGVIIATGTEGYQDAEPAVESAGSVEEPSGIGPRADRILREMSAYLKTAKEFTFHADITYDEFVMDNQKIQYGIAADISMRRPDRLHVSSQGDERQRRAFHNGRTFTAYNPAKNVYIVTKVPPKIDDALDLVFERFGISVPIADLLYADPYQTLTENVQTGFLVGLHSVDGTPCHHLAFSQEAIDWQIWIEDGRHPVPRKLVITYRDEPGSPQYTARLSGWDLEPHLSDHLFEFHPPAGADEIEFLPTEQTENGS